MSDFYMMDGSQCALEFPEQTSNIYCKYVERQRKNQYGRFTGNGSGLLFYSGEKNAFDAYLDFDWFDGITPEQDLGNFEGDGRECSYLFFCDVNVANSSQASERRRLLFDESDGCFIPLLENVKQANEKFPDFRLDTLYQLYRRLTSLIIIPVSSLTQDDDEERDPFYRLGVVVLNYLYHNRAFYVANRAEIDELRSRSEEDDKLSDVYRYVLLRMTEERKERRFGGDVDIVALCKEDTPNKCECVKRENGLVCENDGNDEHIQVFSIDADKRQEWEKIQNCLIPADELPEPIDDDKEVRRDENGFIWRARETREFATELAVPVSFCLGYGVGQWAYVGSVFQFSNVPDVNFYERGGRLDLTLDKQRNLRVYICFPRNIPRGLLTVRNDRYANFPNEEGNCRDISCYYKGHDVLEETVNLSGLTFPLYFRIFSETYEINGETYLSSGEDGRSRFVIENEKQIAETGIWLNLK